MTQPKIIEQFDILESITTILKSNDSFFQKVRFIQAEFDSFAFARHPRPNKVIETQSRHFFKKGVDVIDNNLRFGEKGYINNEHMLLDIIADNMMPSALKIEIVRLFIHHLSMKGVSFLISEEEQKAFQKFGIQFDEKRDDFAQVILEKLEEQHNVITTQQTENQKLKEQIRSSSGEVVSILNEQGNDGVTFPHHKLTIPKPEINDLIDQAFPEKAGYVSGENVFPKKLMYLKDLEGKPKWYKGVDGLTRVEFFRKYYREDGLLHAGLIYQYHDSRPFFNTSERNELIKEGIIVEKKYYTLVEIRNYLIQNQEINRQDDMEKPYRGRWASIKNDEELLSIKTNI